MARTSERDSLVKRFSNAAKAAAVFGGMTIGTVCVCGPIQNYPGIFGFGLISWLFSIVSTVLFLAKSSPTTEAQPNSIIPRIFLGCVVVFSIVFLTAMSLAVSANPRAELDFSDKIVGATVSTVGACAAAILFKLARA